jgi:hypothetical protein
LSTAITKVGSQLTRDSDLRALSGAMECAEFRGT